MAAVIRILRSHGFPIDPYGTGFLDEQVVHTRGQNSGDIFVFPSGTLVSWGLPEDVATELATVVLLPAATNPNVKDMEIEDLEFREDPNREQSNIHGDVITIGTKPSYSGENSQGSETDTALAKIAFSSGLARSTKLAPALQSVILAAEDRRTTRTASSTQPLLRAYGFLTGSVLG